MGAPLVEARALRLARGDHLELMGTAAWEKYFHILQAGTDTVAWTSTRCLQPLTACSRDCVALNLASDTAYEFVVRVRCTELALGSELSAPSPMVKTLPVPAPAGS